MKEHSRRTGVAARHLRAADALIQEVVNDTQQPWNELESARLDRDMAQGSALLWKVCAACAIWGIVLVMLFT